MSGKVIGISLAALTVLGSVGFTGYMITQKPEVFNNVFRMAAYTPEQAYKIGSPESREKRLYKNIDGTMIPILISSKEDLAKLDELHTDIFNSGASPIRSEDFKSEALAFFEKPSGYRVTYSVRSTTAGKDVCFIVGSTSLFEQQSLLARCSIDKDKISEMIYDEGYKNVTDYISYYNDKYSPDDIYENMYLDYFYRVAGDIKATMQLKSKGDNNQAVITEYMKKRKESTVKPYYDFNLYTNTFIDMVSDELDARNISDSSDFYDVFTYTNSHITGSIIPSYDILELIMFEKEAVERNNSARDYIFKKPEIRAFLELPKEEK